MGGDPVSAYQDVPFGVLDPDDVTASWDDVTQREADAEHERAVNDRVAVLRVEADARRRLQAEDVSTASLRDHSDRLTHGGSFMFDIPDDGGALWGDGDRIAWASGESLMLYSAPGLGKTTLAGLLLRGRLGLIPAVLGMPIVPAAGRVLYLAMDRPQQIARALRRQFEPHERAALDERLTVWRGPLAADLSSTPTLLLDMADEAGADTIVVDSLKDAAARLSEDEGGRLYNIARQHALAEGIEILELHHARKASGEGRKRLGMDDIYGSVWIAAGAGSILALSGEAGDETIEIRGVKTPRGDIGPLQVRVDHERGTMSTEKTLSVLDALAGQGALQAPDVARDIYGREPSAAETQKTRRELDRLTESGSVERMPILSAAGGRQRHAYRLAETLAGTS